VRLVKGNVQCSCCDIRIGKGRNHFKLFLVDAKSLICILQLGILYISKSVFRELFNRLFRVRSHRSREKMYADSELSSFEAPTIASFLKMETLYPK
jgi:hypothetical protein